MVKREFSSCGPAGGVRAVIGYSLRPPQRDRCPILFDHLVGAGEH
jgi:hypothetical protein